MSWIRRRRRILIPRKIFRDRENPFDCEDKVFFGRYRFTKGAAVVILEDLRELLNRPTHRSKAFPVYLIVLTSLSVLATGNTQFISGQMNYHNLLQSAVSKMLKDFMAALLMRIKQYIKFPKTEDEVLSTKLGFYSKFGFPNVIGAIDGTHIALLKPPVWDAYAFFNRKGVYSINVQATCNANFEFTDVVVRWPGSTHDSHIYKNSQVFDFLHSDEFPENSWLLGDSGYPLEHCLMTPIISPSSPGEVRYNQAHKAARKIIEQSFGILKSRFRVISKSGGHLCYDLKKSTQIIICCFILHNIAIKLNVPCPDDDAIIDEMDDNEDDYPFQNVDVLSSETPILGDILRQNLVAYEFPNLHARM